MKIPNVKTNSNIFLTNNEASLETALETFFDENSEQSIFLEVFTEMKHDSDIVHEFYHDSQQKDVHSKTFASKLKESLRKMLPEFYHDSQQKDVHSKTFASKLKESLRKMLPNSAMEAVKKIKK